MPRWMFPAATVVLLAGLGWNTMQLRTLGERLEALEACGSTRAEDDLPATPRTAATGTFRFREGAKAEPSAVTAEQLQTLLQDPAVAEHLVKRIQEEEDKRETSEREERSALFLASVQEEVEVLAEEFELDEETNAAVVRELEDRHAAWSATRDDVRAGDLSWVDARREFQAIREASDDALVDLIGAEATEELNTRLFGERGGRGG